MATLIDTVANLLDGITVTKATEIVESQGEEVDGFFIKAVTSGGSRMRGTLLEKTFTVVLADNDDPTSPSVSTTITITEPTSNSASSSNSNPTPVVATPPVAVGGGGALAAGGSGGAKRELRVFANSPEALLGHAPATMANFNKVMTHFGDSRNDYHRSMYSKARKSYESLAHRARAARAAGGGGGAPAAGGGGAPAAGGGGAPAAGGGEKAFLREMRDRLNSNEYNRLANNFFPRRNSKHRRNTKRSTRKSLSRRKRNTRRRI